MDGSVSSSPELNLVTGFLGVPGYILSTFFPTIQQLASRQPRLVKIVCIAIAFFTFGLDLLARIKRTLLSFFVSYFMFSATIDSLDPLYGYTVRWLKAKQKMLPEQELRARSREEIERNNGYNSPNQSPLQTSTEQKEDDVVYDFSGVQIFWHKWRPYFVSPYPAGKVGNPQYLTVRSFGFTSDPLKEIIDEAWTVNRQSDQAKLTAVYRPVSRAGGWKCVARRNRRSLDTIVLDQAEKQNLLEDVGFYLSGEARGWYAARGIPYRRGYLFHGPPGVGKTSMSMAIAGHFALDIYIVSLLDPHVNDTFLHTFFTNLPKGALILLEDIDSAGLSREMHENSLQSYSTRRLRRRATMGQPASRVTLSGLLNSIDGADSPEGAVLIMTTNAPDALDEALVRPGRIDYKIGFRAVRPVQAETIFLRMYTGDVDDSEDLASLATQFSQAIPTDTFTPAELQGHLLRHKKQPKLALENLQNWMDGVLEGRQKLEEAKQKEKERAERKEKKRKAQRKAAKKNGFDNPLVNGINQLNSATDSNDSDSDQDALLAYVPPLPPPAPYSDDIGLDLNGDPTFADHGLGDAHVRPPPPRMIPEELLMRPGRRYRSRRIGREVEWDELNGNERTCGVM